MYENTEALIDNVIRKERLSILCDDSWKRKKIMIVDDDVDFRLAVSEILVDNGFNVMTSKNGDAALNSLSLNVEYPDLILLDLVMPSKNGIEFRKEQLALKRISHIPVIFVTGHGVVDGEICLLKPFSANELIYNVEKTLNLWAWAIRQARNLQN